MSVYYVAQWSVAEPETQACEAAMGQLAEHVRTSHPAIRSVRTLRQAWGAAPRRAYVWYEEFDSLASLEADAEAPACAESWRPIHALALPGTFTGAIWTDPQRGLWFER